MTHETEALVQIVNASRIYRMGEMDVMALREASLEIREGEFLVIVGPSGSGKSTLLNLIGGMDRPSTGRVIFKEEDLTQASERALTRFRRREIGFVFQFYNLIPTLTALENVQVATEIAQAPLSPEQALERVGLAERSDHFPAQLSGGEQQRVAIARALAGNPSLLLCDEPTGALDLAMSRQVLGLLAGLSREHGKTVVLITHNNEIARMGDRVAHLRDGAISELEENAHPVDAESVTW